MHRRVRDIHWLGCVMRSPRTNNPSLPSKPLPTTCLGGRGITRLTVRNDVDMLKVVVVIAIVQSSGSRNLLSISVLVFEPIFLWEQNLWQWDLAAFETGSTTCWRLPICHIVQLYSYCPVSRYQIAGECSKMFECSI